MQAYKEDDEAPKDPKISGQEFSQHFTEHDFEGFESISKDPSEFSKIQWRQRSMQLHTNDVPFRGNASLPLEIKDLKAPKSIFCYFFRNEVMQMIVEESNRAAIIQNINTQFKTDVDELYHYIGILLYMYIYRYPNLDSYWGRNAFA